MKEEETKDDSKNIAEPIRINKKRNDSKSKEVLYRGGEDKRNSSKLSKKKRSDSKRINSSCHFNFNI